ncbi:MAG: choice-of-anchor D domain-containing protein [Gaiellaceae bacterium]
MARVVMCVAIAASLVGAFCEQAGSRVAAGRPTLRVTPSNVEFGTSPTGATKTRTVTITNSSDEPLTLSAGWATDSTLDPGFGFPTGDSCLQQEVEVLQPSQSCTLTFTFTPVSAGVAEATFAFSTDGWQTTEGRVRLKGRGLA